MLRGSGGDEPPTVLIQPVKDVKSEQNVDKQQSPLRSATNKNTFSLCPCSFPLCRSLILN